jgi:DNA-binding PadR family transcriptional regulator
VLSTQYRHAQGLQASHSGLATTLGFMTEGPSLSLAELTVLAVLCEQPAHGFAVARLTAPGGELGRIWQIPRPIVYRAIGRLTEAGLITADAVEAGRGPQRTLFTVTPAGREAAEHWLDTPVQHVRDVRSHLLLKLALLDRAGRDPTELLRRQKTVLAPIAAAVHAERPGHPGFDSTLLAWRRATTEATMSFLDDITPAGRR